MMNIVHQTNMSSVYGELEPVIEHRTQFVHKGK